MIKTIIKLALLLVVGILVYNYFLGTPDEKETSKAIVNEIKDVGRSIGGLLKAEKSKFDEGKYDDALDKIGDIFDGLKSKARESGEWMDRLQELELKKEKLRERLREMEAKGSTDAEKEELNKEMEELVEETEDLSEDMEKDKN